MKDQERCSSSWFKPCLKTVTTQGFTSFTQCTIMERAHVLYMQVFNTCKGYSTTEEREGRQLERNQQTAKHCPAESFLNPTGCSLSLDCDPLRSVRHISVSGKQAPWPKFTEVSDYIARSGCVTRNQKEPPIYTSVNNVGNLAQSASKGTSNF